MALHRLTRITIGVPNVEETAGYYTEFGLTEGTAEGTADGAEGRHFSTGDGGEQLTLVPTPRRRLVELRAAEHESTQQAAQFLLTGVRCGVADVLPHRRSVVESVVLLGEVAQLHSVPRFKSAAIRCLHPGQ